jgi:hypothetical protein
MPSVFVFRGVEGTGLPKEGPDTETASVAETLDSEPLDVGPLTTGALEGVVETVGGTMLTKLSSVEPGITLTVKPGSEGRETADVAADEGGVPLGPPGRPG